MRGEVLPNGHMMDSNLRHNAEELDGLPWFRWLKRLHLIRERCAILETYRFAVMTRDGYGDFVEAPPVAFDGPGEIFYDEDFSG